MDDSQGRERAEALITQALREQAAERYESAIDLYRRSIDEMPTAEGHTFLGWAYSFLGRFDDAIAECRRAIEVDPSFGNPYNDIGSYLMKLGRLEEAIEWLEKAKGATRYEPRHFPYMNLARLYLAQGRFEDAAREFSQARFLHHELFDRSEPTQAAEDDAVN
ncbi:MAG TPA: tetratricopeptide repeat protein [Candidatus Polarisedimenticolia bacterium]|nr:tetratricopeptide repeat protein [Candidatus Polarisedimenticolia bacterium]